MRHTKIIANPKDDLSLLRIANIPKRGLGTTTLGRVANFAKENSIPYWMPSRRRNRYRTSPCC